MIEYLAQVETEIENTLVCFSEAQMGSNHEKKGLKILRHTPFNSMRCFLMIVLHTIIRTVHRMVEFSLG